MPAPRRPRTTASATASELSSGRLSWAGASGGKRHCTVRRKRMSSYHLRRLPRSPASLGMPASWGRATSTGAGRRFSTVCLPGVTIDGGAMPFSPLLTDDRMGCSHCNHEEAAEQLADGVAMHCPVCHGAREENGQSPPAVEAPAERLSRRHHSLHTN